MAATLEEMAAAIESYRVEVAAARDAGWPPEDWPFPPIITTEFAADLIQRVRTLEDKVRYC